MLAHLLCSQVISAIVSLFRRGRRLSQRHVPTTKARASWGLARIKYLHSETHSFHPLCTRGLCTNPRRYYKTLMSLLTFPFLYLTLWRKFYEVLFFGFFGDDDDNRCFAGERPSELGSKKEVSEHSLLFFLAFEASIFLLSFSAPTISNSEVRSLIKVMLAMFTVTRAICLISN